MADPVVIDIHVADVDEILVNFDQVKIYRSTAGKGGPFAELTSPSTRVQLIAGQTFYQFTDLTGQVAYYYTLSYFNSLTLAESSQSEPFPGGTHYALEVISADELRETYLWGFDLKDAAGRPMPDSVLEHHIKVAVAYVESLLDIPLRELEVVNEEQDYYAQEFIKLGYLQTFKHPVLEVSRLDLVFPSNQTILSYPVEWIQVTKDKGLIQILPAPGQPYSALIIGQAATWLPLASGYMGQIPNVFKISYTAGFRKGTVPYEIRDLVGMLASLHPLIAYGDIILGPGISGSRVSLDSLLTDQRSTKLGGQGAFASRVREIRAEARQRIKELRLVWSGLNMVVV